MVVREGKTTAVIDGNLYLGQIVALQGMNLAISKAKEFGVGIVCIARSAHAGRLSDYVELTAEQGMIGIAAASVGSVNIPPYGGMQPFTGTNPMAFGIPAKNGEHILLDFATAASSMSELRRKAARGEPIDEGVMLDGYGMPTSDFNAFLGPPRGVVLPFGGFKGAGLNLVTEILGGLLSGHGPGRRWADHTGAPPNGVFFQALNVDEFQPLEEFLAQVEELKTFAKARKRAPGFEEILLPGERSRKIAAALRRDGIEIDRATWNRLLQCADELGVRSRPNPLDHA